MASREVHVQLGNALSTFSLSKVDRDKLYGKKARVVVDESGNPCEVRNLTLDGSVLIAAGGLSQLYVTEKGDTVPSKGLEKVDESGSVIGSTPSTLSVPQSLQEVSCDSLLDYKVASVYCLEDLEADAALLAGLAAGKFYQTVFAYRSGSVQRDAFLLQNGEGIFLLIMDPHKFEFVSLEQTAPVEMESDDDPFSDDFDFAMM